jgi:hypothetical protein
MEGLQHMIARDNTVDLIAIRLKPRKSKVIAMLVLIHQPLPHVCHCVVFGFTDDF